ncbi:T9SS type A sorting domain-containing protein [Jiulongibacter sediminis]|nr:T9SS type A sorting domain-containing protein [Jiulongibacter sediminis]
MLTEIVRSFSNKKARKSNYSLAVNAVIFHPDNSLSSFDNQEVVQLINRANLYFSTIGLSFYIKDGFVNHIHNSVYQDFHLSEEQALRKTYDKSDAINIYFVKLISREDGSALNGYTSLPTYSSGSNRLMFSYLENSDEDFEILRDKTFLHELGHYFGLLHTFQNSGSSDIEQREVVTRGIGANCAYTGDEICDTPADPFERFTNVSVFNCSDSYPETLQDKYGMTFQPAYDNLMSYHLKCGNVFTEQQYQRMEASLAIRLSPKAEYQLTEADPNFVAVKPLESKSFCQGNLVTVYLSKSGLFKADNFFMAEISDQYGGNFKSISATLYEDSIQIKLPENLPTGKAYRVRVSSTSPAVVGFPSENFEVKAGGKVTIETLDEAVQIGQTARLKVNLTGSGPWNFKLSSGENFVDIRTNELLIGVTPEKTQNYSITEVSQLCQTVFSNNPVTVNVIEPAITIQDYIKKTICEKSIVNVPVKGLLPSRISEYKIKLSNGSKDYLIQPSLSSTSLNFKLPNEINGGQGFDLKVIGEAIEDYSLPVNVSIVNKPGQPAIISPVQYCFNEKSDQLHAEGTNLKWYFGEYDSQSSSQLNPVTTESGIKHYYVSQTNDFGCESERSKIEVKVLPPVTASISGQTTIVSGDSAQLRINLTGQAPWEILLNDGSIIEAENSQFAYYVKPSNSTTYSIVEFTNNCGKGFASGEANIQVIIPLSASIEESEKFQIFPNPASHFLKIKLAEPYSENTVVKIFDLNGKLAFSKSIALNKQEATFKLPKLTEGIYFFETEGTKRKIYIRQ